MDFTTCPECGAPAEIEWRAMSDSTDGPVEHAKIRCSNRHWFLLPVASLSDVTRAGEAPRHDPEATAAAVAAEPHGP
jgi:hypothetical protein